MDIAAVTGVGIGAALGGVAVLLTAAAGAYVQVRSNKIINATAKDVQATARDVQDVKHTAREIDRAVNGKRPEDQTISEQVDDLHREIPPKEPVTPADTANVAILPLVRSMAADQVATQERLNAIENKIDEFLNNRQPNGDRSTDAS